MIKILINADSRYGANRKIIRKAILDKIGENNISSDVELSVSVVGERKMRNISKQYLKDSDLHDVLSFQFLDLAKQSERFINYPDKVLRLGDIVLCWPALVISASRNDKLVDDEVYFLTCHAVEHLLGKHHEEVVGSSGNRVIGKSENLTT